MTCEECPNFVESDGVWPSWCELSDHEVLPDPDYRPCWCPLEDDD